MAEDLGSKASNYSKGSKKNNSFFKENTLSLLAHTDEGLVKAIENEEDETKPSPNQTPIIEQNKESESRSWLNKTFGPIEAGSIRGGIFAISSLALGTGCLALPSAFTHLSLAWGLVFLTIGALVAYWSLSCMIASAENATELDYSRLVRKSLGPFPSMILDLIIVIYIFGILIFYQVVIYQTMGRVICDFFFKNETFDQFNDRFWSKPFMTYPITLGICVLLIPLCLLKDISKMRFTSMFSIASLIYVILVVVVQTWWFYADYKNHYKPDDPSTHANYFNLMDAFGPNMLIFPCFGTIFFGFTCHVGAFPVYKTLKNNISRRINKVFRRSIILDYVIYILVGVCGFLTAPLNPPALIIYRESVFKNDIFMTIGKMAICFNLILSTPPNYNAFRLSFFELFFKTNEIDNRRNYILTIPTLLIAGAVGASYSQIVSYISLLGGFCSVIISFLMPGLLYVKNNGHPLSHWKNIGAIALVVILCSIGFLSGIQTIIFSMIK